MIELCSIREVAETAIMEYNQARRWLKKANTENARLRSALEAVEWITRPSGFAVCAWCGHNKKRGHHSECQRQVALGIEVKE